VPSDKKPFSGWRIALIVSELIVLFDVLLISLSTSGRDLGIFGFVFFAAWLFLFLGSPFLIRSQKGLALAGWCLAAITFLFVH
jgi:hypothetical protein